MGMYDYVVCNCPSCGEEYHGQTKLGSRNLEAIKINSYVELDDMNLELKHECESCRQYPVAVIRFKHIVDFQTGGATHRELVWGELEEVEKGD